MRTDRMAIPPVGWRVPYVIVYGEPGRPLIHSVRTPEKVLFEAHKTISSLQGAFDDVANFDTSLRPNVSYYIMKVIVPVLSRCFSLVGVDVIHWYTEMPRSGLNLNTYRLNHDITRTMMNANRKGKNMKVSRQQGIIPQYFVNKRCVGCEFSVLNNPNTEPLCETCLRNPQKTVLALSQKIFKCDKAQRQLQDICFCCAKKTILCKSLDCPILYARIGADSNSVPLDKLNTILRTLF